MQTLEQAAILAAVALLARHLAVLVTAAAVNTLVADAALEEALAALTGDDAIVQACGTISTDEASTLVSWIIYIGKRNTKKKEWVKTMSTHVSSLIHPDIKKQTVGAKPCWWHNFLIEFMKVVGA